MNISKQNIDSLNAILKIELSLTDYQDRVDTVLANYRKTADMPGFRKGKVPMGVVKNVMVFQLKLKKLIKLFQILLQSISLRKS
ncbi:MAG: hypothetical protein CM15mP23_14770 [Cryomorphaceae bacterium]|nr:MAG: hypothetical protein CM15mP23_14770 [Cryomorphaceae bacterium]